LSDALKDQDRTEEGRSLVGRLVRSAALWVVPALLFTAFSLIWFYRASTYKNFNEPLKNTIQALIAKIETVRDGPGIVLTAGPIDPRYQLALSGHYWVIGPLLDSGEVGPMISSPSLARATLKLPPAVRDRIRKHQGEIVKTYIPGPDGEKLSVVAQSVIFGDQKLVILAAADIRPAVRAVWHFALIALVLMSILAIGLAIGIITQVKTGLAPLFALRDRVADVREGRASTVTGRYPREIKPLADELNSLIAHNKSVVEYARTHVANLAHALKTPLAVLVNEATGKQSVGSEIVKKQADTMSKQVEHHLNRARAVARGQSIGEKTPVGETLVSLVRTLGRIYRDKDLDIHTDIEDGLLFRGEKRDLEEMAGNLLDNACKWTNGEIDIRATRDPDQDNYLRLMIDDNGPGMAAEQYEHVLKRGTRLDENTPGTGFGLSIVSDLARAYKGHLKLEKSPMGGLRTILILPMVKA